ncbi:ImmA/IrrE family metallo-endopeptidase [Enterococcus eurekensis]|uniref:ImmA/IrrE family metallo-endopeptidase n=1 Tax=Enterococcus eurekensis TaxID=1159753 RepID=A0ABV9M2E6_9ENTE
MTITRKIQAEKTAKVYAGAFLKDYLGEEVFLGSEIEKVLAKKASIIYQKVEDSSYYGAAIHMLDKHIIAINTFQPLRIRYYSAAHELWHLQYESNEIPIPYESLDHERAADHFAANVMMPENLVESLLRNLQGDISDKVIEIADLSSMPYVAVTRRLRELGNKIPTLIIKRTEEEWKIIRKELGFPPSYLDESYPFEQFSDFSKEVDKQVRDNKITLEMAFNLIKHIDPKKAEEYWIQRQQLKDEWLDDE